MSFEKRVKDAIQEMKKLGYTPNILLQMIAEHGMIEAVKRLMVNRSEPPKGFLRLMELGRLDLSMETIILEQEFQDLFTEEERNEASRRLKGADKK
jgi:hypothetical protein